MISGKKGVLNILQYGRQSNYLSFKQVKNNFCFILCYSPEEMRFEAYDAKTNPTGVAQYQQKCQELSNSYLEKRRSLLNPTMEMKETLYKIYKKEPLNAPSNMGTSSLFGGQQQQTSNIFGNATSPTQQTKSLFGGSALATSNTNSSSIFGGKPAFGGTSNLFGAQPATTSAFSPTSSIFGGAAQSQPKQGLFGTSSSSGNTLFGQSTPQNTSSGLIQPSIFSSSTQPQQGLSATSVFGSPATSSATSVFGSPATSSATSVFGAPAVTSATSVFGSPAATPSTAASPAGLFGGAAQSNTSSVFGQSPQFSSPLQGAGGGLFGKPQQQTSNLFGQATSTTPQTSSIFGSPAQASALAPAATMAGTSIFGQPAQPTLTSGGSPAPTPASTMAGTSLFGQPIQPSSSATSSGQSIFGQPSAFGQNQPSSIFGSTVTSANTSMTTNVFGAPVTTSAVSSTVLTQNQSITSPFAPKQGADTPTNIFAPSGESKKSDTSTTASSGLFGKPVEKQKDSSVYTPISELTQEDIEAFRTCKFMLGNIPENPPPVELC